MKKIQFRAAYGYDTDQASNEAAIPPDEYGESLTVQSMSEEADINVLVGRFLRTGVMPASVRVPEFGDFTTVGDFRSALHAVMDAQDQFMKLPPKLRAELNNDPQEFLEFVQNPANLDRMREMGLAVAKSEGEVNGRLASGSGQDVGGSNQPAGGGAGAQPAAAAAGSAGVR